MSEHKFWRFLFSNSVYFKASTIFILLVSLARPWKKRSGQQDQDSFLYATMLCNFLLLNNTVIISLFKSDDYCLSKNHMQQDVGNSQSILALHASINFNNMKPRLNF